MQLFAGLGVFIVVLIFIFLLFPKKPEAPIEVVEVPLIPVTQNATPPYVPETVPGYITAVPEEPRSPAPQPFPLSVSFGVPLISGTVAYDFSRDGLLSNADVSLLAQTIDQRSYSARYDLDANGAVDVQDLALIRSALLEYPDVCYDLNMDQRINNDDISIVAMTIDQHAYTALFDFDANGAVDVHDLAMIRSGVADAGSVGGAVR